MREPLPDSAGEFPWTANDVINVTMRTGFGLVLLLVGWVGASGEADLSRQLKWINCAAAGLIVAGVASGLWQLAGLRRVRQRQAQLLGTDRFSARRRAPDIAMAPAVAAPSSPSSVEAAWCTAPGMTKYHTLDCPVVQGKAAELVDRDGGGLDPCGICRP